MSPNSSTGFVFLSMTMCLASDLLYILVFSSSRYSSGPALGLQQQTMQNLLYSRVRQRPSNLDMWCKHQKSSIALIGLALDRMSTPEQPELTLQKFQYHSQSLRFSLRQSRFFLNALKSIFVSLTHSMSGCPSAKYFCSSPLSMTDLMPLTFQPAIRSWLLVTPSPQRHIQVVGGCAGSEAQLDFLDTRKPTVRARERQTS